MTDQETHITETSPITPPKGIISQINDNEEASSELSIDNPTTSLDTDLAHTHTSPPNQNPAAIPIPPETTPFRTTSTSPPTRTAIETPFIDRTLKIKNLITHSPLVFLSELSFIILDMRYTLAAAGFYPVGRPFNKGEMETLLDLWDRIKQFYDIAMKEGTHWGGDMYEEFERVERCRGWGRRVEEMEW